MMHWPWNLSFVALAYILVVWVVWQEYKRARPLNEMAYHCPICQQELPHRESCGTQAG